MSKQRRNRTRGWDPTAHRPQVSPFYSAPAFGPCTLPDDVEHCHGMVIRHDDGVRECHLGPHCEVPDGMHFNSHACAELTAVAPRHRCATCR